MWLITGEGSLPYIIDWLMIMTAIIHCCELKSSNYIVFTKKEALKEDLGLHLLLFHNSFQAFITWIFSPNFIANWMISAVYYSHWLHTRQDWASAAWNTTILCSTTLKPGHIISVKDMLLWLKSSFVLSCRCWYSTVWPSRFQRSLPSALLVGALSNTGRKPCTTCSPLLVFSCCRWSSWSSVTHVSW
jgi:hypothetical protein